ncbi:MAG: hypothetical protein M1831_006161 [Alyxoria varia]|nr:MAG: hypothetical protein M1831_006161 [Alyxoria varia]
MDIPRVPTLPAQSGARSVLKQLSLGPVQSRTSNPSDPVRTDLSLANKPRQFHSTPRASGWLYKSPRQSPPAKDNISTAEPTQDAKTTVTSELPPPPSKPLEFPFPAAWCFSPANTGNPYFLFDDVLAPYHSPPPPVASAITSAPVSTPHQEPATITTPQPLSPAPVPNAWSFSPVNTGDPILEAFLYPAFTHGKYPYDTSRTAADEFYATYDGAHSACAEDIEGEDTLDSAQLSRAGKYQHNMADYGAFLDKAAADKDAGTSSSQQKASAQSADTLTTASVPCALHGVKATYTSDADEPFEPVSIAHSSGKDLTAEDVAGFAGVSKSSVQHLKKGWSEFDPQGSYGEVREAVKKAAGGEPSVWKVEKGGARCEYWVLGFVEGKVVGFRAKAVES